MPFEVISSSGNLISIKITGELKKAESDRMQAVAAEVMKREGKIRKDKDTGVPAELSRMGERN